MARRALIAVPLVVLLVLAAPLASAKPKETPPGWLRHGLFGAGEEPVPDVSPGLFEPGPAVAPPAPASEPAAAPLVVLSYVAGGAEAPPAAAATPPVLLPQPFVGDARARQLIADLPEDLPVTDDVAMAAFAPAPSEAAGAGSGLAQWTWLIPVLGLVSLGAAVATARPRPVVAAKGGASPRYRVAAADVPSMLRAGRDALQEGHVDEAVVWFTHASKMQPRLAVAHFSRGVCLSTLGELDEAYRALRKAYELDPREGAYVLEYARASARTGRHHDALGALRAIISALPEFAPEAAQDEAFASLRDHPMFLAMVGRL